MLPSILLLASLQIMLARYLSYHQYSLTAASTCQAINSITATEKKKHYIIACNRNA